MYLPIRERNQKTLRLPLKLPLSVVIGNGQREESRPFWVKNRVFAAAWGCPLHLLGGQEARAWEGRERWPTHNGRRVTPSPDQGPQTRRGQKTKNLEREEKKALPNFRACIHKEGERVCIKCGRARLQEVAWDLASLPCPLPECSAVPGCVCLGTEPQAEGLTRQTLTLSRFRRLQVQNQGTNVFSGW